MFVPVPPQESKDSKKENMSMSSAPSYELIVVAVAGRDEAHAVIAAQDFLGELWSLVDRSMLRKWL